MSEVVVINYHQNQILFRLYIYVYISFLMALVHCHIKCILVRILWDYTF